ncbi:MAG: 8-amino-7-oxononanoate synthase [Candidatus Omnitrophota bacterium]|nr:8-amino-7-oxononanoate synthase [Candidatus Omnitrophota bacterium]
METIEDFLNQRKEEGLLRKLRPAHIRRAGRIHFGDKEYIDLSSNDYLGLSNHPKMIETAREAAGIYGVGSSASRLLSGDLEICHELEERIAEFKGKEAALIFNSGYQANVGILSALYGEGDCIFSDKLNHASIVDGLALSGAKFFRFSHNDTTHLEALLEKERAKFKNALIITETIFSMDGDRPGLKGLVGLKKKFDCKLMVDEAHATGIFGKNGSGVVEEESLTDEVDLIMGTFGKALGSFGAYLASSGQIIEYMINRCRSFIYSTALSPITIACNLAAIDLIEKEPRRREELLKRAHYFRNALEGKGFNVRGSSQIVPVIMGENQAAVRMAEALQAKGYWALPIRPPTVPEGEARLRFSLTYDHDIATLEKLANDIAAMSF